MIVFRCAGCRAVLSAPVREVPLPPLDGAPLPYELPDGGECPPRLAPGTFAHDPDPYHLSWTHPPAGAPAAQPGAPYAVLGRGDVRGVAEVPRRRQGCCGPSGSQGPNLACAGCGREVAVETADCGTPQQVAFTPDAVVLDPVIPDAVVPAVNPVPPG